MSYAGISYFSVKGTGARRINIFKEFCRAAMTNLRKHSDLRQHRLLILQLRRSDIGSGSLWATSKVSEGRVPLEGRGAALSVSLPFQLLEASAFLGSLLSYRDSSAASFRLSLALTS